MQSLSWQEQLAQAIRHPNELLDYVGLDAQSIGFSSREIERFPVRIPYVFANRIKQKDPDDPILRQVFPYIDEEVSTSGFNTDPLQESRFQPVQGLLHKYDSRVLVITTGACAIHCRYCFRRYFPYQDSVSIGKYLQHGIQYIKDNTDLDEVILSGGDPLSLSDRRLFEILHSLSDIDHIKRIRFHTRIPVVLPDRLSENLIQQLVNYKKSIIFVIHTNHTNELDDMVAKKIYLLQQYGILVLNQSVLLKGVNDSVKALLELSEKLVSHNVLPYYLHLLDPVSGTAHYDVPITVAQNLIKQMQTCTSGYLIPRLVKEEVGASSKMFMVN